MEGKSTTTKPLEFFAANPYCVLGIPADASRKDVIKAQEKIEKLAKLGAADSYKPVISSPLISCVDRSSGAVQSAIAEIKNPVHRLFWFTDAEWAAKDGAPAEMSNSCSYDEFLYSLLYVCTHKRISDSRIHRVCDIIARHSTEPADAFVAWCGNRFAGGDSVSANDIKQLFCTQVFTPMFLLAEDAGIECCSLMLKLSPKDYCFNPFRKRLSELLVKDVEDSIKEQISFLDGLNFRQATTTDVRQGTSALQNIDTFCKQYGQSLLANVDAITQERIRSTIYQAFMRLMNLFALNDDYTTALKALHAAKAYMPKHEQASYADNQKLICTLARAQDEINGGSVSSTDLRLINSDDEQVKQLVMMAIGGDADAQLTLGFTYCTPVWERNQPINIPYDEAAGVPWLKKAANRGNINAAKRLAVYYLEAGNQSDARTYLQKAADAGDWESKQLVAQMPTASTLSSRSSTSKSPSTTSATQSASSSSGGIGCGTCILIGVFGGGFVAYLMRADSLGTTMLVVAISAVFYFLSRS